MAARRSRRPKRKRKRIKHVVVLKNGSMRTKSGKRLTWAMIAPNAKFFHKKQ